MFFLPFLKEFLKEPFEGSEFNELENILSEDFLLSISDLNKYLNILKLFKNSILELGEEEIGTTSNIIKNIMIILNKIELDLNNYGIKFDIKDELNIFPKFNDEYLLFDKKGKN